MNNDDKLEDINHQEIEFTVSEKFYWLEQPKSWIFVLWKDNQQGGWTEIHSEVKN